MASKRIKGITIEIDGNTTPLTKSLKDVDKSLKSTQDELKDVNKLLKLDPSNVELLRQKNDLLKNAIDKTKERQQELIKALEQAKKAGDTEENRRQQDALQRELIETTQNLDRMEKEMAGTATATKGVGDSIDKADKSASIFSETLKAKLTGEAIISAVKKLGKAMKELSTGAVNLSDELQTQATKTGLSTDALQEYAYMAELVDTDVETITGSMSKLTRQMNSAKSGTGTAADAFQKLGVKITDANGQLRDNQDVFNDVIDALGRIQNETERDATAMELFGKSAQELNPLIRAGSDQIKKYAQEAHDMGYVLSQDVIQKNVEASDAMARMNKAIEGAKNEIGSALAPVIKDLSERLTGFIQKCRENSDTIEKLGKVVVIATAAFVAFKVATTIVSALEKLKKATEAASAAQAILNTVMNANPFVLVAAALGAVTAAVMLFTKKAPKTNSLVEEMKDKVDALHEELTAEAEAWDAVIKAQDDMLKSGESEIHYYNDLWDELQGIVDENGKVKEGYEARAKFITGTLSDALGREIELTGNQIKDYQNLRGEIDKLIATRRAELQLKAGEEAYTKAIQNRDQATVRLITAGATLNEAQATWAASNKQYAEAKIAYDKALEEADGDYTDQAVIDAAFRMGALSDEVIGLQRQMQAARDEYNAAKDQSAEYSYAIAQYEQNLAAAHEGEFEKISTINYETAKSYQNMSGAEKDAVQAMYGDLINNASGLYNEAKKTAENVITGATAGLKNQYLRGQAYGEIRLFGNSLINTMRQTVQVRSPSKATEEIGEYFVQGFGVGIADKARSIYSEVSAFGQGAVAALQGSLSRGVNAELGINTAGANALINAKGPGAGIGGVNVSVVVNGNVDNYDELAATIGQKLQQQMAREQRAWA